MNVCAAIGLWSWLRACTYAAQSLQLRPWADGLPAMLLFLTVEESCSYLSLLPLPQLLSVSLAGKHRPCRKSTLTLHLCQC